MSNSMIVRPISSSDVEEDEDGQIYEVSRSMHKLHTFDPTLDQHYLRYRNPPLMSSQKSYSRHPQKYHFNGSLARQRPVHYTPRIGPNHNNPNFISHTPWEDMQSPQHSFPSPSVSRVRSKSVPDSIVQLHNPYQCIFRLNHVNLDIQLFLVNLKRNIPPFTSVSFIKHQALYTRIYPIFLNQLPIVIQHYEQFNKSFTTGPMSSLPLTLTAVIELNVVKSVTPEMSHASSFPDYHHEKLTPTKYYLPSHIVEKHVKSQATECNNNYYEEISHSPVSMWCEHQSSDAQLQDHMRLKSRFRFVNRYLLLYKLPKSLQSKSSLMDFLTNCTGFTADQFEIEFLDDITILPNDSSTLVAHVTLRTTKSTQLAMKKIRGHIANSASPIDQMVIEFIGPRLPTSTLWIGNISEIVLQKGYSKRFRQMFEAYGIILRIKFMLSKSCAFVEYMNTESAKCARNFLYGTTFGDTGDSFILNIDFLAMNIKPASTGSCYFCANGAMSLSDYLHKVNTIVNASSDSDWDTPVEVIDTFKESPKGLTENSGCLESVESKNLTTPRTVKPSTNEMEALSTSVGSDDKSEFIQPQKFLSNSTDQTTSRSQATTKEHTQESVEEVLSGKPDRNDIAKVARSSSISKLSSSKLSNSKSPPIVKSSNLRSITDMKEATSTDSRLPVAASSDAILSDLSVSNADGPESKLAITKSTNIKSPINVRESVSPGSKRTVSMNIVRDEPLDKYAMRKSIYHPKSSYGSNIMSQKQYATESFHSLDRKRKMPNFKYAPCRDCDLPHNPYKDYHRGAPRHTYRYVEANFVASPPHRKNDMISETYYDDNRADYHSYSHSNMSKRYKYQNYHRMKVYRPWPKRSPLRMSRSSREDGLIAKEGSEKYENELHHPVERDSFVESNSNFGHSKKKSRSDSSNCGREHHRSHSKSSEAFRNHNQRNSNTIEDSE